MPRPFHSLALLSLGPRLVLGYGAHSMHPVTVTATVTVTQPSTVTLGEAACNNVVYVPTTVTVYGGYSSASGLSSVSGLPISSSSGHGPWFNATSTPNAPCTHGLSSSTGFGIATSSRPLTNTSLTSRPTSTGTAGTTIESADPIGTSIPWTNSTRPSSTEQDVTTVVTLTVTSSAVVTVSGTAPGSDYGTATGLPGNHSTPASAPYQPSLTYQTTAPAQSTHSTPANETATKASTSKSLPIPPSLSLTTILNPSTTTASTALHNNTSTPKPSTTIYSTESNDPLFTTSNTPRPSTTSPTFAATTTTTTNGGDNNGGDYGSYSYPSPTTPSQTVTGSSTARGGIVSSVVSVAPIGGTTTGVTGPGTGLQPTLTLTRTTFFTETWVSLTTTASSVSDGYGEGYDGYY